MASTAAAKQSLKSRRCEQAERFTEQAVAEVLQLLLYWTMGIALPSGIFAVAFFLPHSRCPPACRFTHTGLHRLSMLQRASPLHQSEGKLNVSA